MRIGIIGLGDIAQKAYLPVIAAMEDIQPVLCTRNRETLRRLAAKYRVAEAVQSVEELIGLNIDAAFIHASTESHALIAEQLLRSGVHVYIDKPISYDYEESERLTALAEQAGRILMVGFNRRFAPMLAALEEQRDRHAILLQKNRLFSPDFARRFIYDDFIHVVDTIRFLAPGPITEEPGIFTRVREGKLVHVQLQLQGDGFICTGIMNRDSGANDEIVEVMSPGNKWVVHGLNTTVHFSAGGERHHHFKDWDSVLFRRGFVAIVEHFIACVRENRPPAISPKDALESHRVCELIVRQAEAVGAFAFDQQA
ncbi:Gfo/Idh/MocA family oxidoreductase [Paenibacillus sp. alder61]|uniref:Gfo/Idh/MocA family oxidoreductase n=1 Tax=Paenibacillus faecis TaxID=862114 RepID=A0A5D0CW89_9BACL|nr:MULTISPECIES: Gfo/Idh/MocA family oxidoreductase [Paenibacillus]MCA1296245.1 Gfo/Idh/MocA family oxidoreductase [Paenibacillus sp. alder61]TYA14191.1 Gfo/Idh/MocA family oxidoreductase [Paenibacillus faecis]